MGLSSGLPNRPLCKPPRDLFLQIAEIYINVYIWRTLAPEYGCAFNHIPLREVRLLHQPKKMAAIPSSS